MSESNSFYPPIETYETQVSEARGAYDKQVDALQRDTMLSPEGKQIKAARLRAELEAKGEEIRAAATKSVQTSISYNASQIAAERQKEVTAQRDALRGVPTVYADMMKTRVQNTDPKQLAALLQDAADDSDRALILGYAVAIHGANNWDVATLLPQNPKLDKLRESQGNYEAALKAIPSALNPFRDEEMKRRFNL